MKRQLMTVACAVMVLASWVWNAQGQEGAKQAPAAKAEPTAAAKDMAQLIAKVRTKIRAGQKTEADLAEEVKEFDALIAKHAAGSKEDLSDMLFMKGALYLEVIGDKEKGKRLLEQVKTDYPGTKRAGLVDKAIAQLEGREAAKKVKADLVGKPAPELNFAWASRDGLKTLSELKGKVVVLDFWATWCGPCVRSFPDIKELAEHYKGYDVEVIGVTSIQGKVHGLEATPIDCEGDEAKEMSLMKDYMKAKDMTWTVAFSKEEVFNPQYGVTGIPHMTVVGADGKVSENGIHPGATPFAQKKEMIDKLLKEAGLKTPPAP